MAYATTNFKSKKALREAVAAGQEIGIYNPSGLFPEPDNGNAYVEGPWNPKPHSWYAAVEMKDGVIVKVKK